MDFESVILLKFISFYLQEIRCLKKKKSNFYEMNLT